MKKKLIYLSLLVFSMGMNAQIWVVDPLKPIYPDKNDLSQYSNRWEADFAKGTPASAHILLKIPKGENFSITATINNKELDENFWKQLIEVPVEQNTGLGGRTEIYLGKKNPYVIREAPFEIFEVIKPVQQTSFKSDDTYSAFRVNIPKDLISDGKKIENVLVRIKIEYNDIVHRGVFKANFYPITIPEPKESEFFYTNWFNLSQMEAYHNLERWSKDWFVILDEYAEMMAHGRQNSISLPDELITYKNGKIGLEEGKMLQFINVFRNNGFRYFEAPHLMNRGENDDWGDPELKVALTGKRYYKENGYKDIDTIMNLIRNFTISNDLENSWLQHISDEPTAVNAQCYKDVAKQVKKIFPKVRIMEATNARDELTGAIDIWCPVIDDFQKNENFFRQREDKGEKVLVYTCLVPGGKWLNRTLDMEKLRQVYFGWGASYYDTGGYLHWGLNQYNANPFEQSVVHHPSPAAGPNNFLPAGDTHIIYPGKNGPLSSIRFEAHRIGIEDYELLEKLKSRNLSTYKKLVNKLFRSYTDYNLDIKEYREVKKQLLESLVK